jgi:hypothetical protein
MGRNAALTFHLSGETGAPGGAGRGGQFGATGIATRQATEIGAISDADAGDEKTHTVIAG